MTGICGNLYSMFWVIRLYGAWLELPIVVTEFAGALINLMVFDTYLGSAPVGVALVLDALVVPVILASKASAQSPMMQWMHAYLLNMPEFVRREHAIYAAQIYGPRLTLVGMLRQRSAPTTNICVTVDGKVAVGRRLHHRAGVHRRHP